MASYTKVKVEEEGALSGPGSDPDPILKIEKDENKQNQTGKVSSESSNNGNNNNKRYWMKDLYNYPYSRMYGSASGLYNLAWAQAVQNKPLNEVLVEFKDKQSDDKNNNSSNNNTNNNGSSNGEESGGGGGGNEETVSEVSTGLDGGEESEKEEGELEEGEIDLDTSENENEKYGRNGNSFEMEDGELEIQVSSIRKVLDNVTVAEANKSFDIVCARLKSSLESLRQLVLHTWFPSKDALIQRSFDALLSVHSVFSNMSPSVKDQNKDKMSRLLTFVMSQSSSLFTAEQRKEVEAINAVINPPALPKPKPKDKQEQLLVTDKAILTDSNTLSVNAGGDSTLDYLKNFTSESSDNASDKKNLNILPELVVKPPHSNVKSRGNYALLLDLHKVHDEDSLPSPTSKSTPSLPAFDSVVSRTVHSVHTSGVHPYETDALKAVSFYQQRFGRSSFLTQDRLPSPTPSEDGNDGGNDDAIDEVSSFAAYPNTRNANPSVFTQPAASSVLPQPAAPCVLPQSDVSSMLPQPAATSMLLQSTVSSILSQPNVSSASPQAAVSSVLPQQTGSSTSVVQGLVTGSGSGPSSTRSNSASRTSAKSRDPRLRHINSSSIPSDLSPGPSLMVTSSTANLESLGEMMNLKKTKAPEGSILDVPALKRLKSGLDIKEISKKVNETQTVSGSSALENSIASQLASRVPLRSAPADPRKLGSGVITSGVGSSNPSVAVGAAGQSTTGNTAASLQSLLKDIAGNPTAWMNIFKEQQKSAEPSQSLTHPANSSSLLGTISSPNTAPAVSSARGQNSAGSFPNPQLEESAKLRMKPRDPRRVLHSNIAQKVGGSGSEQPKVSGPYDATTQGFQDSLNIQRPVNVSNNSPTSQATESPDIAVPLTKSLMNLAEIMSAPQTSTVQPLLSTSSPQSVHVNLDRVSVNSGGHVISSDQHESASRPENVVAGCPQSQNAWGDVEHLFEGYDDKQKAAIQQERARRMDEQKKMFAEHKLCLVLDLDHTLLNSAKFTEVDPIHDEILRKKEEQDREKPRRHLFRFPHMGMWTKLRPGIWNFLEKASKLYELHLYTMGNKLYATEMAKVLDPKGTLFSGRVISRGHDGDLLDGDERVPKSKDLEGVLGMESAVVIIDDSVRVWPHNKLNLIVVERYTYFPCSRRQFGLPGPSLLEIDHDERPEEGTLASSLAVIERIHENFFSHKSLDGLDVRSILAAEQRKILDGCRIVFSRVFPVGEANPHMHPLWQTAEQFGAVCTNQIDEQVTHVVANSLGTDKVNWALSTGRYVVHPGWVEASALLYRRANEQDFAIKP